MMREASVGTLTAFNCGICCRGFSRIDRRRITFSQALTMLTSPFEEMQTKSSNVSQIVSSCAGGAVVSFIVYRRCCFAVEQCVTCASSRVCLWSCGTCGGFSWLGVLYCRHRFAVQEYAYVSVCFELVPFLLLVYAGTALFGSNGHENTPSLILLKCSLSCKKVNIP